MITRPSLAFILGPTNVGKSTLLENMLRWSKEQPEDPVGSVEVGKMMRAKYLDPKSPDYQPDYFKGSSSPAHTEAEALHMMYVSISEQKMQKRIILIDGQPRNPSQVEHILRLGQPLVFINLYAEEAEREMRARARDHNDPDRLSLSLRRMQGDIPALYEVLNLLILAKQNVFTFRVGKDGTRPVERFLIEGCYQRNGTLANVLDPNEDRSPQ